MARKGRKRKSKGRSGAGQHNADPQARKRQQAVVATVMRLAEPLCADEGFELVHVEYQREPGGLTLRLYLDKPGGVTLDDCVGVSRQLDDILDVHGQDLPPYRLEVSSPGIDRPVGRLSDFERFAGNQAKIRLAEALDGQKNFNGILVGTKDQTVQIQLDDERVVNLDFTLITKARLINYNGER